MTPKTCTYYEGSEVFRDCPKAWDAFFQIDSNCSWGSNSFTIVAAHVIYDAIDHYEGMATTEEQINTVKKRIENIGLMSYVDLES